MASTTQPPRSRKHPHERREEILRAASAIALHDGLDAITLRAVAERIGVRPGLIGHYFPAVQTLVIAAFTRAVAIEREQLIPAHGSPGERMTRLAARAHSPQAQPLARLWLNARHLSRFEPTLATALQEQETLDRARLLDLIVEGIAAGDFRTEDPFSACVRILIAVDGVGAYVNNTETFDAPAYEHFVADVAEWSLGLSPGALRDDDSTP
jgi:AcrR family transcriptional regulator